MKREEFSLFLNEVISLVSTGGGEKRKGDPFVKHL